MPDLKQELQALADRRSAESATDFDAVLTTAVSRRRRRTAVFSAAAAALAVVAVVAVTPWNQAGTTPAPAATESPRIDPRSPNPVTITPATARPGATVALTFPDGSGRGIAFQLAKATEPNKVLYYMTSDKGPGFWGKAKPLWWAAGEAGGWEDIGISGPGPDQVVVPDTAEDGTYLLCTANAASQVCGLLTVRR
jgi:hypothetical protein